MWVEYNRETNTSRVLINNIELSLGTTDPLGPFAAAGINARRLDGFDSPGMFTIDDFALSGSEEIPYPAITPESQTQSVLLGYDVELSCAVSGGLPPYSFQWSRSNEVIATDDAYTVTMAPDGSSSSLTIHDYDPSLEGSYLCEVVDSRYGDPMPVQGWATITSDLPDFKVLWRRAAGEWVFVANAFQNGVRQNWLQAGVTYDIEVVIDGGGKVHPDLSFPVTIYADCHASGHQYGPPYLPVGSVMAPGGAMHVYVPIEIDAGCLGDADWGILSLIADVNAEEDPADPLGYPTMISEGQPYLAENGFGADNRQGLQSWIPVAKPGFSTFAGAVGSLYKEIEFDTAEGTPARYPTEWTMADPYANYWGDALLFHLYPWFPCYEISDAIPSNYRPYVAWDTGKTWTHPVGGMTRHRMAGAYAGYDDNLYFGTKQGTPPLPSIDLTNIEEGDPLGEVVITDAARLGPTGEVDSKNLLSWVYNRQYHVLVWNVAQGSLVDDPGTSDSTDGVSVMELPDFPDGTPHSGNSWWMYLGFEPAGLTTWGPGVACDITKFEWYYLDSIRLWGAADGPPEPDVFDYDAGAILLDEFQDGTSVVPMPSQAEEGSQMRPCVEIQESQPDLMSLPATVIIEFGSRCVNGDDGETTWITVPTDNTGTLDPGLLDPPYDAPGRSVHCLVDASSLPPNTYQIDAVTCTNSGDVGYRMIRACLNDPGETPGWGHNNCTEPFELTASCPVPAVDLP